MTTVEGDISEQGARGISQMNNSVPDSGLFWECDGGYPAQNTAAPEEDVAGPGPGALPASQNGQWVPGPNVKQEKDMKTFCRPSSALITRVGNPNS